METNRKETNCLETKSSGYELLETNSKETNSSGDELLKTSRKETNCLEMKSRGTISIYLPIYQYISEF